MESLDAELARARELSVADLADAIESIGFECTRCGACCKAAACGEDSDEKEGGDEGSVNEGSDYERSESDPTQQGEDARDHDVADGTEPHTATVFPDEVRQIQAREDYDWRDVARPMPYGLEPGPDGDRGATFEWALQTDDCGDCVFYEPGACTIYGDRPLVCRTYPFSVALGGTSQPLGEAVDREGLVRAHECEGLGREISREAAEDLAATLRKRAIRELEEAIAVRDRYDPAAGAGESVVVYDSEGPKRPDGTSL